MWARIAGYMVASVIAVIILHQLYEYARAACIDRAPRSARSVARAYDKKYGDAIASLADENAALAAQNAALQRALAGEDDLAQFAVDISLRTDLNPV
jgi:hypothetical protein